MISRKLPQIFGVENPLEEIIVINIGLLDYKT